MASVVVVNCVSKLKPHLDSMFMGWASTKIELKKSKYEIQETHHCVIYFKIEHNGNIINKHFHQKI
jgi:hypothetical protein